MKCWLHPERDCNSECAAYLKLESGKDTTTIDGVPLWRDKDAGMYTYCALVSGLYQIGYDLNLTLRKIINALDLRTRKKGE